MKIRALLLSLLLLTAFSTSTAFAKANSIVGNWSGKKITLNLKNNHRYTYTVKILGVKKTFKGKWSTKNNILTLEYSLLGKRSKTAKYALSKGRLKLIQNGKTHYLKRR